MGESSVLGVQALVDLLSRRDPDALARLREKYPSQLGTLQPGKKLGAESGPPPQMLQDLARVTIVAAKKEGETVVQTVRRKIRTSARLRLAGAVVSSLSSAGLIAALTQGYTGAALVSGGVALVSSCFTLVAQYVEDYAGGQNSLRELRERASIQLSQVWEAEAEFGLMTAVNQFGGLEPLVRKLNVAASSLRQIQIAIG